MIRPTANTPNTTVTTVSVISHLGRFQNQVQRLSTYWSRMRRTPRPVPGKALMRMIIDLLASPGCELIPLFGVCYRNGNNATSNPWAASNRQVVLPDRCQHQPLSGKPYLL